MNMKYATHVIAAVALWATVACSREESRFEKARGQFKVGLSAQEIVLLYGEPDIEQSRGTSSNSLVYLPYKSNNGKNTIEGFEIMMVEGKSVRIEPVLLSVGGKH
jgi:hypothetical protein